MPKMFIPPLGSKFTLAKPWTLDLWPEYRNAAMMAAFKIDRPAGGFPWRPRDAKPASLTLPEKSELTIRRIYIRQGATSFDSVTLSVRVGKKQVRFWVKLACFNQIEFEETS